MFKKIISDNSKIKDNEYMIVLEDYQLMREIMGEKIRDFYGNKVLKAPTFKILQKLILIYHSKGKKLTHAFLDYDLGKETDDFNVTGVNAVRFIKNIYPECLIIALSGDKENNDLMIAAGANKGFQKDIDKAIDWLEDVHRSELLDQISDADTLTFDKYLFE